LSYIARPYLKKKKKKKGEGRRREGKKETPVLHAVSEAQFA
jgi:hypothetical protein